MNSRVFFPGVLLTFEPEFLTIKYIYWKFEKLYKNKTIHTWNSFLRSFEPAFINPVRFKLWIPDFDRVSRVNFDFLKKSKRRFFSKKQTKINGLQLGFWLNLAGSTGSPGHAEFWLFLFFLKPGPVPAPGQPSLGSTHRAGSGFKTMLWIIKIPQTLFSFIISSF